MALQNSDELLDALRGPVSLGKVFARHAYGMRAWVDLFSARVPGIEDPATKALFATLVADNARHMMLFRERAIAHGVDPDAYSCPDAGEAIYTRLDELDSLDEQFGYALGSLDHFSQLLAVYRAVADGEDAVALDSVIADVDRMRDVLRPLCGSGAEQLAAEAHELYRVRELVETPLYAGAG
jgi:hypothetical protein